MILIFFVIFVENMLQNLNAKTSQILLKMFTMPTLELSLGTKMGSTQGLSKLC